MKQYRPANPLIHVEINKPADADWTYQVCEIEAGGTGPHHRIGPKFPTNKAACAYANVIEERRANPVSPLRVEASPAGADSRVSPFPVESASAEAASA
jgi:hypothetical protein